MPLIPELSGVKTSIKALFLNLYFRKYKNKFVDQQYPVYLIISIDTEQDFNQRYQNTGTYCNIESGIQALSSVFDKHACKVTWMITPDVAGRYPEIFKKMRDKGDEIGCHLHPEFFTRSSIANLCHMEYLCSFSRDEQNRMVKKSTDIIVSACGIRPVSFRSGRFGINHETLEVLQENGYLIDSSMCPNMNWSKDGGPDWSDHPNVKPYFVGNLLEVPITILHVGGMNYWLRPSVSTTSTMKNIIDYLRFKQKGPVILNMMFHSMESINPNPYVSSGELITRLDEILSYLTTINVTFITLSELYFLKRK
jgi:peptidoglycan/xylan/chitin deacetylase (PgdA/CDA1 family)